MVKSPSSMVSCLLFSSVIIFVVPTDKPPVIDTLPFIEPPVSPYLLSKASCNPFVFAMVKSLSSMVSCLASIFVMAFTSFTYKSPVISTLPFIEPPVSPYLLSKASCNQFVFAMVKSPSSMLSCFP